MKVLLKTLHMPGLNLPLGITYPQMETVLDRLENTLAEVARSVSAPAEEGQDPNIGHD